MIGQRQQEREARHGAEAGQHADNGSPEAAHEAQQEVRRRQDDREAFAQGVENIHGGLPQAQQPGRQNNAEAARENDVA